MYRLLLNLVFILCFTNLWAQDVQYQSVLIAPELTKNANAVVRNEVIAIEVVEVDELLMKTSRTVTVLNEHGEGLVRAYDFYDNGRKIKEQKAVVYDKFGKEIKEFRKKDFEDRSALSSGTLISDNRVRFMDYTARDYPYTVVYESEIRTNSTIFVRTWDPVSHYYLSVENASYSIKNPAGIPLRFKEKNLSGLSVEKNTSSYEVNYKIKDIAAYDYEPLSPNLENFTPQVLVALNEFALVGVEGTASNWIELGKWQYDHLLQGKTVLSPEVHQKMDELTAGAQTTMEKAKRIYEYMQENTRYISVQLGIGGWEPMTASEVHDVKYGDCKALTNYTIALLDTQNIPANYAVVFGGEHVNIDKDFASMQGNHVILNLPLEGDDLWLECTSQTIPFGYLGDFTDNRDVLLVKPEGGEIVKTKEYTTSENLEEVVTNIELKKDGSFDAVVERRSTGIPFGNSYHIMAEKEKDQILYYKKSWGHLKNLDFKDLSFMNNKASEEFIEKLSFSGERLTSVAGNYVLLPLNFLIPETYNLPINEKRQRRLEVLRGRSFKDTFRFILPHNSKSESIPDNFSLKNDFGSFDFVVNLTEVEGRQVLEVKRHYIINKGLWPVEAYEEFREFMNKVNSISNQKAVFLANATVVSN